MKIWHPDNETFKPLKDMDNHFKNGFYSLVSRKEEKDLTYFLECFEDYTKKNSPDILKKKRCDDLPYSSNAKVWKERRKDIDIISSYINDRENLDILDVGCWNGWLSNHFSKRRHNLIATNIFIDEINGIQAKKYFSSDFISLQMISDDIFRIKHSFDIIVFNRNWAYVSDKQKTIENAKSLLKNKGIIIFTGLSIYHNTLKMNEIMAKKNERFLNTYNIPLLYKPSKGYLDTDDLNELKENSVVIKPYSHLRNLVSVIFQKDFKSCYGILRR